jgi:hypothetical protein
VSKLFLSLQLTPGTLKQYWVVAQAFGITCIDLIGVPETIRQGEPARKHV